MTLILFDVDGTLTATGDSDMRCYSAAYTKTFGYTMPSHDWHDYVHVTDSGVLGELLERERGSFVTDEEMARFETALVAELEAEYAAAPEGFAEVPGARRLVEAVAADDRFAFSLATGCFRGSALFKLAKIGLDASGFAGGFANDSFSREDIARTGIARAAVETDDIVYIGDGVWDARTSAALGMRYVGVTHEADEERLRSEGATVCVRDYHDLDAFFEAVRVATIPEN